MLIVGSDKSEIVDRLPDRFLFIDDGELIDRIPKQKLRGTLLNLHQHHLNPLSGMDHKQARQFAEIIYSAYPQGQNTLTIRNGRRALCRLALVADHIDKLPRTRDDDVVEANNAIDDVLLSPVVRRFVCGTTNFSLSGILIARLDRKQLDPLDCFLIANLLISSYKGHVVIPDFGFYACPFHMSLMREGRLSAGVNFLDEVDEKLRNNLLLMPEKHGVQCTYDDAVMLAKYSGLRPDRDHADNEYERFINDAVSGQ